MYYLLYTKGKVLIQSGTPTPLIFILVCKVKWQIASFQKGLTSHPSILSICMYLGSTYTYVEF